MEGANLVDCVTAAEVRRWDEPLVMLSPKRPPMPGGAHVVAIDCGIKHNILRSLAEYGCHVTVVPAGVAPEMIRELKPDGLLVGNGPGDPAAVTHTIATLRELLGQYPTFGICLGHQMLALALGAETYKLRFGHHGANQPVRNEATGRVEITSQNHGFAVDIPSLEAVGGRVTHVNLNDGSLEGFVHPEHQIVTVQFHPEACPGPHDSSYLFRRFADTVRERRKLGVEMLVEK
jgi:carbamoyl-phosphate synthase small subunit